MARTTATFAFNAIELKGSMLPGSLLDQVARFGAKHQDPKDYGLEKNERLRDRIDAAWVLAKDLWAEYVGLKERAGQGVAGLHFSLRLLREVFEWDDVQPVKGWQRGDSSYPITHRAFGDRVPLILKGVDLADLDRGLRDFGQENHKRSPHSCLQECLNADDDSDWGLLITGDRLRLLHDNPSLVKPAYLGADLEWMIEGDLFDEFAVLWLTLHASRFRHPTDDNCVLDGWKQEAEDTGERILGQLRGGVQIALEELGNGVLAHHANQQLREALENGVLSRQAFHEELLRLVYRFLFLFTAEDRELLFPQAVGKDDRRRQVYREGYSVGRLRELALERSAYEGTYSDLWELQRLVFHQLEISTSPLGLPGLGGLFVKEQCPNLHVCELENRYLLRAIKAIGWFDAGGTLTRVNYRDLNTEELGSVYEGLLELHPQVEQKGGQLQFSYGAAAGSDRKTTGSYYTPDALVQELIKSALVPVIDDRLSKSSGSAEQEKALLSIKVIDPACGSGHFLLAAARKLAKILAQIRAGDDEPNEEDRQHALRDVVSHCIYAVDKNPMAVQLCKVALWMEAIDPGKPLGFLDAHIQLGDALVGVVGPKLLEQGIPDEAYKPLAGDNKTVCSSLKKDNAAARRNISRRGSNRGIQGSLDLTGSHPSSRSQQELKGIEAMPDASLGDAFAKQAAYTTWLADRGRDPETLAANLFTAAFFLTKTSESRSSVPTTEHLLKLLAGQPLEEVMEEAVEQTARNFRFFHWHLRFGDVMERGGFDCILGNPPWDTLSPDRREYFGKHHPGIRSLSPDEQEVVIDQLISNPVLKAGWERHQLDLFSLANFLKSSGRYTLYSPGNLGKGDLNIYRMFAELALKNTRQGGYAGQILPGGLYGGANASAIRQYLFDHCELTHIWGLINTGRDWFKEVDIDRFAAFAAKRGESSHTFLASFGLVRPADLNNQPVELDADFIRKGNPNTYAIPDVRSIADLTVAQKMLDAHPAFGDDRAGPPNRHYQIELHMGNDRDNFTTDPNGFPVYEGRMITHFDHRAKTYAGGHGNSSQWIARKHGDPEKVIAPQWRVMPENIPTKLGQRCNQYRLAFGDVANPRNERSFTATLVPPDTICGHKVPTINFDPSPDFEWGYLPWLAVANSFVMDWLTRSRLSSLSLTYTLMDSLPFPRPVLADKWVQQTAPIVLRLICTAPEMTNFWNKMAKLDLCQPVEEGTIPQSALLTEEDREHARAELDAIVACEVYNLTRTELSDVLETFSVLKKRNIKAHGEFRTKRLILDAFDIRRGQA